MEIILIVSLLVICVLFTIFGYIVYLLHTRLKLLRDFDDLLNRKIELANDNRLFFDKSLHERLDSVSDMVSKHNEDIGRVFHNLNVLGFDLRQEIKRDRNAIGEELVELFGKISDLENKRLLTIDRLGTCEMRGDNHKECINELGDKFRNLWHIVELQKLNVINLDGQKIARDKPKKAKKSTKSNA